MDAACYEMCGAEEIHTIGGKRIKTIQEMQECPAPFPFIRPLDDTIRPQIVHCVSHTLGSGHPLFSESSTVWDVAIPNDWAVFRDEEQLPKSYVEFIVRVRPEHQERIQFILLFNDVHFLGEGVSATAGQYYRFPCLDTPLWNLVLLWGDSPVADCSVELSSAMDGSLFLDPDFGIRVDGIDLMHCAKFELNGDGTHDSTAVDWKAMGNRVPGPLHASCVFEPSIEFIVHGLTGKECIDVYVNGFSVVCQEHLQLEIAGKRSKLRYTIGPMSYSVEAIVIRTSWDGHANCGVVVDPDFGIIVSGYDCLPAVRYFEDENNWRSNFNESSNFVKGMWIWEGLYVVTPYKRKRKKHVR